MRILYAKPFCLLDFLSLYPTHSVCLPPFFYLSLFHFYCCLWKAYHYKYSMNFMAYNLHFRNFLHHSIYPPPPFQKKQRTKKMEKKYNKPNTPVCLSTNFINLFHHFILHIVHCTFYSIILLINVHSPFFSH